MIPRIVLDILRGTGAILPGVVEDRIRRIAAVVNGGLDASSLKPTLKFSIGAVGGTVQNAWREKCSIVSLPITMPKEVFHGTTLEGITVVPVAGTVVGWMGWVEDRAGVAGRTYTPRLQLNGVVFDEVVATPTDRRFSAAAKRTLEWRRSLATPQAVIAGDCLRLFLVHGGLYYASAAECAVLLAVPHSG